MTTSPKEEMGLEIPRGPHMENIPSSSKLQFYYTTSELHFQGVLQTPGPCGPHHSPQKSDPTVWQTTGGLAGFEVYGSKRLAAQLPISKVPRS